MTYSDKYAKDHEKEASTPSPGAPKRNWVREEFARYNYLYNKMRDVTTAEDMAKICDQVFTRHPFFKERIFLYPMVFKMCFAANYSRTGGMSSFQSVLKLLNESAVNPDTDDGKKKIDEILSEYGIA